MDQVPARSLINTDDGAVPGIGTRNHDRSQRQPGVLSKARGAGTIGECIAHDLDRSKDSSQGTETLLHSLRALIQNAR